MMLNQNKGEISTCILFCFFCLCTIKEKKHLKTGMSVKRKSERKRYFSHTALQIPNSRSFKSHSGGLFPPSSLSLFSLPLIPTEQGKDVREVAAQAGSLDNRASHVFDCCNYYTAREVVCDMEKALMQTVGRIVFFRYNKIFQCNEINVCFFRSVI